MKIDRRRFMKTTALSAGILGHVQATPSILDAKHSSNSLPCLQLKGKKVSRLIIGGNPFSFIAHAEPLVYSRELFRRYFTHDKVVETLVIAKKHGINTFLGRIDDNVIGFLKQYKEKTGEAIPWLAQTAKKPSNGATKAEVFENIDFAIDNGATGIYIQGESADYLVKNNAEAELVDYLEYIRAKDLLVCIGAHDIRTIEACEAQKIIPDFYMKTFNSLEFCCPEFDRTKEVMAAVSAPWIAFKILAAGRMEPEEGFAAAIKAGADFLCVGMFDFQVEEDAALFIELVSAL